MTQEPAPLSDEVFLNMCQDTPPLPVITAVAPMNTRQVLFIAASDHLYAVSASDGTVQWCQQVILNRQYTYHPGISYPPPLHMAFGTPRVVNDVVYVCISGRGGYTTTLNAEDGSLRWSTRTDGWIVAMPFMDYAVPLVEDAIVYNGTYALHERDGTVFWRTSIDVFSEGALSLHALANGTLYANTQRGIYAINAANGEIRWLYEPEAQTIFSGPLIVADDLLYVGTSGSVGYPEKSHFFALDRKTGLPRWHCPMGSYVGAVVHNEYISVSSQNGYLYTFDKNNGKLHWKYRFARVGLNPAFYAENILYLNNDGAYALNSTDGTLMWHKPLNNSPAMYFTPSLVLGRTVYLASIDGRGQSILYALNASDGTEYWHCHYPSPLAPLAVAR